MTTPHGETEQPAPTTVCPRCAAAEFGELAVSPVPGAWRVLRCDRCLYSWRTTEPARRSSRAAYPERFRMSRADIDEAPRLPPVPDIREDTR
ncbi:non-oxidative hydroxyarylic acid decarboxylases subunit D [Actinopolyspora mortivallis]|uniref:4-hydroxybenzoate decarboxylase n=1 Tax=Actinopolyspora mortivallis TaxID=33906 RepID=A0A2T0GUC0_ACTMO|nr:non-oxidative hydroxyarylic acid decarboxylases subunit D [Actinopolyspora mortivallis]PRW62716.1 hypothetical protein CEP50_13940 [Actinopolyspora mortivallis]